ncbi:MAG: TVP38/TMEM64 family protein [Ruminococcaceae bacterium]|nr:TVP38/TMEM64 family protein [Oscillospiraceae bacterium]
MNRQKRKNFLIFLKFAALIAIIIAIPLITVLYFPDVLEFFKDTQRIDALLEEHKTTGFIIYILLQILQVVISVIPGEVVQLAGGYMYGIIFGTLFSLVGITLGTIISFYFSRFMGKAAVEKLFGEEKIAQFTEKLNKKRARLIIFVFFLIPAIPKDLIVYAAGVSSVSAREFFILSMLGRIPALTVSMAMGKMVRTGNYISLIILAAVATVIFIICIIFRKKVLDLLERIIEKK